MAEFTVSTLLLLLVGAVLIALAVLVLRGRQDRLHNLFFAALYLLSGIQSIAEAIQPLANDLHAEAELFPTAYFWFASQVVLACLRMPLLLLFLLSFPRPVRFLVERPHFAPLVMLPTAALAAGFIQFPQHGPKFGVALNILGIAVTVVGFAAILRTWLTTMDPIERKRAQYLLIGFLPAFVGTWLVGGFDLAARAGAHVSLSPLLSKIAIPSFEILAAALTAFAILKYQLLGFELQVKTGLKYGLTTAVLFVPLFVLSEWVGENVLEPLFGWTDLYWLFAGVTGVTLFKPVEKGGEWLTNRIFPDAAGSKEDYNAKRAAEIYHAQATYILRDARVTARELQALRNLRKQLGLTDRQARAIEERVEKLLRIDVATTGRSATPRARSSKKNAPPRKTAPARTRKPRGGRRRANPA